MKQEQSSLQILQVFYDSECPICDREIKFLKRKSVNRMMADSFYWVDICNSAIGPGDLVQGTDRTHDQLMREIHARFVDTASPAGESEWLVGPEVFRQVYSRLGFGIPVWISRLPIARQLVSFSYNVFAWFRYRAALKRFRKKEDCKSRCQSASN